MRPESSEHGSSPEEEKRTRLEQLCGGVPDAIYLLSGVSEVQDVSSQEKKYKPGSYADVDWKGHMTGGKARALASIELANKFPDAIIAVNSNTFQTRNPEAPTDADVMAEYMERKGVQPERILKQDNSTTTFTELIELVKYIAEHEWQQVAVVAGETQKPRAEEMLRQIATLHDPDGAWQDPAFRSALEKVQQLGPKIVVVSSEDVLPLRDERYAQVIAQARETETWKVREKLDQGAVEDLRSGTYWQKK